MPVCTYYLEVRHPPPWLFVRLRRHVVLGALTRPHQVPTGAQLRPLALTDIWQLPGPLSSVCPACTLLQGVVGRSIKRYMLRLQHCDALVGAISCQIVPAVHRLSLG
jgi:hypothetical protein